MNDSQNDALAIFCAALELPSMSDQDEFVANSCEGNRQLRDEVRALLKSNREAGSFLAVDNSETSTKMTTQSPDIPPSRIHKQEEKLPERVGPYKIREKIGEGGMGVVYVAEQTEPVQRKVAIKIIKPGMDTKEVIARFEAERQALAFMEHPNIARVLDAGSTESGRSYFVMELVRGIPITEYCDQVKAKPRERLELFQTVCDAVQHAHQKGIIHRDIKPSNVLVTQVSAKPVVKVIDFGLAKATSGQRLTEKTVYTGFMRLMGTPSYMSPEQAGLSGLDVDTRSDVYSLGILLYELLTGTTPLDKTKIMQQAYEELCRQIREVEAPKPSARISTLKDAERSTIAQHRQQEPKTLRQLLDGDLDVVVMKAIEKDRERRYESPKDLAADVDRFLNDQPVVAVPASQLYLARKYFRRHRTAILTTVAFLGMLMLATAFSSWQAVQATKSGREADAARLVADQAKVAADQTAEDRRRELYVANMQLADQLWNSPSGAYLRMVEELLTAWIPVDGSEDLREFSWRYQWNQLYKGAAITVLDTTDAVVSAEGNLLTADTVGIHEWDESGTSSTTVWSGDGSEVTFSPDGRWAAIEFDGETQLIEIDTGNPVLDIPHGRCSFSTRSEYLAAWTPGTQTAQVWKLSGNEPTAMKPVVLTGDAKTPDESKFLQLSDDGRSFILRGYPHYSQVSMFSDDQNQPVTWQHRNNTSACGWSPNGRIMASGDSTGIVYLRPRSDPSNKLAISSIGEYLTYLRFSADGSRLAVAGFDGTIDLWDTSALMELRTGASVSVVFIG